MPPAAQETQLPPLQTMSVPHDVPLEALFPVSWQDIVPAWQLTVPLWHGLVGVQLTPLVQATHAPPLHTLLVPHDVPFVVFPAATQTGTPVEQVFVPVLHGLVGWQDAPAVQAMQAPPLHTLLVAHDIPLATFAVSEQTAFPVMHVVAPILQGLLG